MFFIIPCMDSLNKVDLRTVSFDVPPQEVRKRTGRVRTRRKRAGRVRMRRKRAGWMRRKSMLRFGAWLP